jgi:hypothetical protein
MGVILYFLLKMSSNNHIYLLSRLLPNPPPSSSISIKPNYIRAFKFVYQVVVIISIACYKRSVVVTPQTAILSVLPYCSHTQTEGGGLRQERRRWRDGEGTLQTVRPNL